MKHSQKNNTSSLNTAVDNNTFQQDMKELDIEANQSTMSPGQRGSNSVSGSTPDPESDDDVLENAHQVGIAPDADLENPTELNIAKDVAESEEYLRTH